MSNYNQPTKEMVKMYLEGQGYPDLEYLDDFLNPMENKEQYWQAVYEDIDMCDFDRWQHFQRVINHKLSWDSYREVDGALYGEDIEVMEMPINTEVKSKETKREANNFEGYEEVCVLFENNDVKITVEYNSSDWCKSIVCVYDSDGRMANHWNIVSHGTMMSILEEIHRYTVDDVKNGTYADVTDGLINMMTDCFDMVSYDNPPLNAILDIKKEYGEDGMYRIGNSILVW